MNRSVPLQEIYVLGFREYQGALISGHECKVTPNYPMAFQRSWPSAPVKWVSWKSEGIDDDTGPGATLSPLFPRWNAVKQPTVPWLSVCNNTVVVLMNFTSYVYYIDILIYHILLVILKYYNRFSNKLFHIQYISMDKKGQK